MKYDTSINISGREVALDKPVYFIADIAANHDGDINKAKKLIYLAKQAGADCAKFQHFLAKDIVSDYGFKSLRSQQSHQTRWEKSVYEIYEKYQCPRDWTSELAKTCDDAGIDFMTTPYDFEAIESFSDVIPAYKIGSGDITWTDALNMISLQNKPVLLATGASLMEDVERAVNEILSHNRQLVLMQCNTNYTADFENFKYINLNVLNTYVNKWPGMVLGFSDHTLGHTTVLGAVTLGARVIEKHFTDDNSRPGPDHHFAMNPVTWKEMVERTRELEYSLGDGVKRVEKNELETVVIQRRSIRLKNDLIAGTVLSSEMLESLRPCPGDGLEPYQLINVIGKSLLNNMKAGEHIKWTDLS